MLDLLSRKIFHLVPFTPGDLTDHQVGTDDILTGDPTKLF